jgi:hypothetical protein
MDLTYGNSSGGSRGEATLSLGGAPAPGKNKHLILSSLF